MALRSEIIEIPVGRLGLNASANVGALGAGHLVTAQNISFANGSIQKEAGADKYNSSALTDAGGSAVTIRHGFDWWPDLTNQRMIIFTSEGKLLRDTGDGSFGTELKTGLTDSDTPWFVAGGLEASGNNRKLFFFNGNDPVQVLSGDGTSTSNLSTPPSDWSGSNQPTTGVIHEGRMWGAGNANDPHRVYFSLASDHEDFTTGGAGSISVWPGFGKQITALMSFKGFLIVFKEPRGIFVIDTSDSSTSNWRVFQSDEAVGTFSQHLVAHMRDGIAFLDHVANLWFMSAVDRTGNVAIDPLFPERQISVFVRDNIDFSKSSLARMAWYPNKSELHIPMTGTGATTNNRDIVLDLNGDTPRFRVNVRDTMMSLWMREESGLERPVFGNDEGFIYRMDRDSREKDESGYGGIFETAPIDFSEFDASLATIDKNGMFLEVVMEPKGNWDLSVDIIWDGAIKDTVTLNLGGSSATLGSFVLGTDALSGDRVLSRLVRILGSGRRLSLKGRNSGKGQDFSLSRFFVHYQRAGQRPIS